MKTHGFLRTAAGYTTIGYPDALSTTATGITPGGVIVGTSGHTHGFRAVPDS